MFHGQQSIYCAVPMMSTNDLRNFMPKLQGITLDGGAVVQRDI